MKLTTVFGVILAAIVLSFPSAVTTANLDRPVFVPGEILVQFRDDVDEFRRQGVVAAHGLKLIRALRANGILKFGIPDGVDPRARSQPERHRKPCRRDGDRWPRTI